MTIASDQPNALSKLNKVNLLKSIIKLLLLINKLLSVNKLCDKLLFKLIDSGILFIGFC
jgi:hypothetical protein